MSRARASMFVMLLAAGTAAWADQVDPLGAELAINAYTPGSQTLPSVAVGAAGELFVVWQDESGSDGSTLGIRGRRFDSAGDPLGGDFIVNVVTANAQRLPDAVSTAGGGFVVVWEDYSFQDGSGSGIQARRFDSNGEALGGELAVNAYTPGSQVKPAISAIPSGGFVVAWADGQDGTGQDGSETGIEAQRFDSGGALVGDDISVNTVTSGAQSYPGVAVGPSGGFVIVWADLSGQDGSGAGIQARRFASDGSPMGVELAINTYTPDFQFQPSIAVAPTGEYLVAWEDGSGQDGSESGVQGRILDASGTPLAIEFPINGFTSLTQGDTRIAALASGDFVVVWNDSSGLDGDGYGVRGRIVAPDGALRGEEFPVNGYTSSDQIRPAVADLGDGRFIAVWQSDGGLDGEASGIRGQRLLSSLFRDDFESGDTTGWDDDFGVATR